MRTLYGARASDFLKTKNGCPGLRIRGHCEFLLPPAAIRRTPTCLRLTEEVSTSWLKGLGPPTSTTQQSAGRQPMLPSCTTSPPGARATSRSARTGICWSIPPRIRTRFIDLKELVDKLELRGIHLPILIRFAEILKHRLGEMHGAFQHAIKEHGYKGELSLRVTRSR